MLAPVTLRPEIAAACRFVLPKPAARFVRPPVARSGILAELASGRGLR
jgi:hypothetical protein